MTKLSVGKQMRLGAILSYLAIGINILSALIYSPWMLSKIGSGDYGIYTLAHSLIHMFLLDFGISSAVSRFVSKYKAEGQQEKINQLLGVVYKLFFGISALISVVLIVIYFFVEKIYMSLTVEELEKFKVVYIIAASYSVFSLPLSTTVNGVLNSYEKFVQIKLTDVVHKLLNVALIVIALLCGYGLYSLVAITAGANLATLLFKQLLIKINTPIKIDFKYWDKAMLKEIFGFSVWVLINSICSRLIMSICPNILGITAGTLAITIFSFASTIEGYSYTFASAIDGMFMPRIARITAKNSNMDEILRLMIKVGRFQYNLVGLIVVGFIIIGREFITLWIGSEYINVYYCAVMLLLPAPFYLSQQIGKNTMVMLNKIRYLTYVNVIKAGANIVLVALLSYFWGAVGACVSISFVYFFRNFANMYLYKNKLGIDTKAFKKKCYGKMSITMLIVLVVGIVAQHFIGVTSWVGLFIKIVVIAVIYIVLMWFIAYNQEEKTMFKNAFKKILKRKAGK